MQKKKEYPALSGNKKQYRLPDNFPLHIVYHTFALNSQYLH